MAGFRALARQVRDPDRDPSQRRQALRKCLERFAPYGHRATWQHLCRNAGFHPDDREPDPALLVAALEELEEARAVWLAYESEVAARRKREKREGIRQPTALDEWHRRTWGGRSLLRCDPAQPPTPRLAEVLRRMISVMDMREIPPQRRGLRLDQGVRTEIRTDGTGRREARKQHRQSGGPRLGFGSPLPSQG
ncbi:hypothetical protein FM076_06330 [Streptomyces albus subsp. chlorinus]|uniref:hypothetical protein n=1 Tax=Streptomyces albus TaxID=1888 RepID=UPI00156E9DD3|nr:hypothetical protein [Streptomyces albus]NSC20842.1 hypothetical protein [Streptomyces albus subsp. chlorinus]